MGKRPNTPRGDYEVGKGRPPVASRWKTGQSGNPRGRPKASKNTVTLAREELNRRVEVSVGGKKRPMTVREVALRRLADKAMAGDPKMLAFLLAQANELQPTESDRSEGEVSSIEDEKIILEFFARRMRAGAEEP